MDDTRCTTNGGVCVRATSEGLEDDYYGVLREAIQLSFSGQTQNDVAIFRCDWFDNRRGRGLKIHNEFGFIDIHSRKKYPGNDPFIMANQAEQVYYTTYPAQSKAKADWWSVCKVKARNTFDIDTEAYQEDLSTQVVVHGDGDGDEDGDGDGDRDGDNNREGGEDGEDVSEGEEEGEEEEEEEDTDEGEGEDLDTDESN